MYSMSQIKFVVKKVQRYKLLLTIIPCANRSSPICTSCKKNFCIASGLLKSGNWKYNKTLI